METRKLYYEDCHLREFSATVLRCQSGKGGYQILLDATAFYPEGGGQACDLGVLGDANVLDVQEAEGEIYHLCDRPIEIGSAVTGRIDWARRFDLMQQHSGEHIVSGIVHSMFGYHNVGFHVGSDRMEIDFDGPISADALVEIENRANRAVWDDLPIRCWYPSEQELPNVFYRTKKQLPWPVRIVQIPGTDSCACCGVHVSHTGQIGVIKILSCVKFHQGVRIELTCGGRALQLLQKVFEENRQVSAAFSAKLQETGAAARRMNELLAAEKLRANTLQTAIFDRIAEDCADAGHIFRIEPGLTPALLRDLADKIAGKCGGSVALFSGSDESGYSYCLASRNADLRPLNADMNAALSGRGGGKPSFQQGSVKATEAQIRAFFADGSRFS